MSHKHKSLILKALALWPNCVMFVNGPHTDRAWRRVPKHDHFPSFSVEAEYAVVPSQHEAVARAFYAEGKDVEVWTSADDYRSGYWREITEPSFYEGSQYRVKPELPKFYKIGDKFLIGDNLYILAATSETDAAMINMHSGARYDDPVPRGSRDGNEVSAKDLAEYRSVTEQALFDSRVDIKVGELVK